MPLSVLLCLVLVAFLVGVAAGAVMATAGERDKAVKAGVGRWVIHPMSGHTSFRYEVTGSL